MTQQIINIGSSANDGTGDPLRTAFNKINTNFTELYNTGAAGANFDLSGNEIAATNSNGNVELVPNGSGRVVIVDDHIVIADSRTPTNIGVDGDVAGMLAWDANYLYICTADYDGVSTIWSQLSAGASTDLTLSTDASNSLTSSSNGNINITPNGTGSTNIKKIYTANAIVSTLATGTAPFTVASTTQVANLNVAASGTAVTVTAASQPNITSVGTLTSLTTSGNVTVGNVLTVSGNSINSSTATAINFSGADVTIVGNLTVQGVSTTVGSQDLTIEDSIINLHSFANLAPLTSDDGRDIGIKFHYYKTSDKHAFVGWDNSTSYLEYYSDATETAGSISGTLGSIRANTFISNVATGTAPFTVSSTTQVANLNAATAGSSTTAGTVTTAAQPNITSVGTLTGLTTSGQITSTLASGTAPFVVTSTTQVANLNVATAGSATTAGTVTTAAQPNITSVGTLSSVTVGAGTTSVAPINLTSGTNLTSATAGTFEYDGSHFYATPETTSGRAKLITKNTFRLASNGSAIGATIADFFGATSSINLAASSVYEITYHAYFLKTTAGTATWTLTASSAPTLISGYYTANPVTGVAAGAPITGYAGSQAATTAAFAATASLTTAVNHSYAFKVQVITNAATTFKLQLTQSAGTATPLAGSYYTVERLSGSVGSFA
jgi:hypothetical protein